MPLLMSTREVMSEKMNRCALVEPKGHMCSSPSSSSRGQTPREARQLPTCSVESRTHIVGECGMYKEERDVLEAMMKTDECGNGKVWYSEKTIAILGDR